MTVPLEPNRFHWQDAAAIEFFCAHGYVVVHGVLDECERAQVQVGWHEVVTDSADRYGIHVDDFVEQFPQNRDLWRKNKHFHSLLHETSQAKVAQRFLRVSGVRLFHDHAICKPARRSAPIPWHQDSAYWPFDRVGLSLWTPTTSVDTHGGCLKVIDASHLNGPCEPQDFLSDQRTPWDADPRLVRLPVRCGETVVLHGLTWHGSDANTAESDRLAYLTLWVPATSRFVAEHAGWHPSAAHIRVGAGERLEGEMFPLFGVLAERDEGESVVFPAPKRQNGASMFTAGKDIAEQMAWLLEEPKTTLNEILDGDLARIVRVALGRGYLAPQNTAEFVRVLEGLALQEQVRRHSVARDVYLRNVERWWALIGCRIHEARRAR